MTECPNGKFIIYQMILRVFGNTRECVSGGSLVNNGSGHFSDVDEAVLDGLKKLSVSYIWFTGTIRHSTWPEPEVKGLAGSPYAISDYSDVNPYLADDRSRRMEEFSAMVSRVHRAGMGVILDFVPNHVSCNYDNTSSPIKFYDSDFYPGRLHDGDWTDTVKINYSNRSTWVKMRDILLLWCGRGADGFRCDMAELVTLSFWEWCIPQIKQSYPHVMFIAEVYQPDRYREYLNSGFDYLYDKSCFYDTLIGIMKWGWSASALTGAWQRLGDIQPRMLNFMENHDELRLSSPYICGDPFRGLPAVAVSLLFNRAPFMIYFGQEFGEDGMESAGYSGPDGRTTIYDWWSLPGVGAWLKGLREGHESKYLSDRQLALLEDYRELLGTAVSEPAFSSGMCYDLQYVNPHSADYDPDRQFSFLRFDGKKLFLCAVNFCGRERQRLKVHVPSDAFRYFGLPERDLYVEINTEDYEYREITPDMYAFPL